MAVTDTGMSIQASYLAGTEYHACNWNFNTIPEKPFILSFYYFGVWGDGDRLNLYAGHAVRNPQVRDGRTLFKTLSGRDRPDSVKIGHNPSGSYSVELLMDHRVNWVCRHFFRGHSMCI